VHQQGDGVVGHDGRLAQGDYRDGDPRAGACQFADPLAKRELQLLRPGEGGVHHALDAEALGAGPGEAGGVRLSGGDRGAGRQGQTRKREKATAPAAAASVCLLVFTKVQIEVRIGRWGSPRNLHEF
jgi:hypothetical protein